MQVRHSMLLLVVAVLVSGVSIAAAPDMGRLFTSSSERLALDKLRKQDLLQRGVVHQNVDEDKQTPPKNVPDVLMNGVVKHSNGNKFVWINGEMVAGQKSHDGIRIYRGPDHNNRVLVKVSNKPVVGLKPGQRWNSGTGKVTESYSEPSASDPHAISP